jgi:hypothetical protein
MNPLRAMTMQREAKGAEKEKIKELLKKNKGLTA